MRLDTDSYHDGGIERHEQPIEPDEPVGFEPGGFDMSSDAETRATTTGAATATAPDFSASFNDLRGCPKMSRHHGATEGGGILPAASGEGVGNEA